MLPGQTIFTCLFGMIVYLLLTLFLREEPIEATRRPATAQVVANIALLRFCMTAPVSPGSAHLCKVTLPTGGRATKRQRPWLKL